MDDNKFDVKVRQIEKQRNTMNMLGELLIPVTEGFPHVNLDMAFTYLGNTDLWNVENLSSSIDICDMYNFKQSSFLLRGKLATLLTSRKSRNAKSMNLFTEVTTHQKQEIKDLTRENKGFNFFGFNKKSGGH